MAFSNIGSPTSPSSGRFELKFHTNKISRLWKAGKQSAALKQGLEISEPGGLRIELDGGPEGFAEIPLMKPKSVDAEDRAVGMDGIPEKSAQFSLIKHESVDTKHHVHY
ncbi:unnamed protein product [Penicillium palitans]